MRLNRRMTTDEILLAQVRRNQELRNMQQMESNNDSPIIIGWIVVACILWTACLILWYA